MTNYAKQGYVIQAPMHVAIEVDEQSGAIKKFVTEHGVETGIQRVIYAPFEDGQDLTTTPTTGTWAVNDTVWHSAPATGSPAGWVCSAAGTPGTWEGPG